MQAKVVVVWHHEGKNPIIENSVVSNGRLLNKKTLPKDLQSDCGKTFIGWTQSPTVDPDSEPADLIPIGKSLITDLPNKDTIRRFRI